MIKCFGFGKLLKQFFIISLISCFGFLVSSSASAVLESSGYSYVGTLNIPFTEGLYNYNISSTLNFTTSLGSTNRLMFYRVRDGGNSPLYQSYFWYNNYLYTIIGNDNGIFEQGYVQNWCITPNFPGVVNGNSACDGNYRFSLDDIVAVNPDFLTFTIENLGSASPSYGVGALQLCFYDGTNYYCVACSPYAGRCPSGIITGNVVNIPNLQFSNLVNIPLGRSPFMSSNNYTGGNVEIGDSEGLEDYNYRDITNSELIYYFENSPEYKFNQNVCKVGTDDFNTLLSSVYNSGGVSYSAGLGSDIFQLYSSLYGTSFTITDLGSFVNVRRNNYGTIFMTSPSDRLYRMLYNGNGTVNLEYDNLDISRYMSLPYVFYTFGQINYSFGNSSSIGEEVATYCYYKLGYDNNLDYDIVDNHNSSYDSSAGNYNNNVRRSQGYRSGSNTIVSQSWEGTPLDYFTGDDDLDFSTFFSKSFNKWKEKAYINPLDLPFVGALPVYIMSFLCALVFFRFISR